MKKLLAGLLIAAALIWGIWLIALPGRALLGALETFSGGSEIGLEPRGFKKGLFYNFRLEELEIKRAGQRLLIVNDISGRVDIGKAVFLKMVIPFRGTVEGGLLEGKAVIGKKRRELSLSIRGAEISGLLPRSRGRLDAEAFINGGAGELKFSVTDAEIKPESLFEIDLPVRFHTARGAMTIKGRDIEIKSLSLEGKGLYARIKGNISGNSADLTLELMPEEPPEPFFALAERYKVAPGFYRIPIKKDIGF